MTDSGIFTGLSFRYLLPVVMLVAITLSGCQTGGGSGQTAAEAPEKALSPMQAYQAGRHPVPREHPRLLGSLERLKGLKEQRPEAYARMDAIARRPDNKGGHQNLVSMSLVAAIENDKALGRRAIELAMQTVEADIRQGHVTFGADLARTAVVYDLCWPWWTEEEKKKYFEYFGATVDANVRSERAVFHNAWYSYKNWGYGLASYATMYEYDRAPEILATTMKDYETRAAPALELAGNGGGWAEGFYVNYWQYKWFFFCEAARFCEGLDLYALAPSFFRNRAVSIMFEAYPGIREYDSRRAIPQGDGGGASFHPSRDEALAVRRILASYYRNDPAHQVVHAFNEVTPKMGGGSNAYKDFLWHDTSVTPADYKKFKLSHHSPGAGYVHARSSWEEDATYFFFKAGDRYTAHQHLDIGHFNIYKYEELACEGGHYDVFGTRHDVNYHLRTIAHSTITVLDPSETWTNIRAYKGPHGNDGGQRHNWPHHNGSFSDPEHWQQYRELAELADITALEDQGDYLYVAADCSGAYHKSKLEHFTRQIVFLRPNTFVIFDRVKSTDPSFAKTWRLQAAKVPQKTADGRVTLTNGKGKLTVQTLLPQNATVELVSGDELYSYGGETYLPRRDRGATSECRVEVSPPEGATQDYFLHVLTASDAGSKDTPVAEMRLSDSFVKVNVADIVVSFNRNSVGGSIDTGSGPVRLAATVQDL